MNVNDNPYRDIIAAIEGSRFNVVKEGYPMRIFAIVVICGLFSNQTNAQAIAEKVDPDRMRVELLIEQLASRNAAPIVRGNARRGEDQTIRFPETFDRQLQTTVYSAMQALLAEDDIAIDVLMEHVDDARYSFSVNSYKDCNVSVGRACTILATQMLMGFEDELQVVSRSQFGVFPVDSSGENDYPTTVLDYWRKHRNLGAAKIQVQAIDAMLEYFRTADSSTEPPWHPDAQRLETAEFNRRRDENIKYLTAIRRFVSDTGRRYRTNRTNGTHDSLYGFPWTSRKFNK